MLSMIITKLLMNPEQKKLKQKQRPKSRRRGKQFNSFVRQPSSPSPSSSDLTEIPETSFRCSEMPFPGLYADVEANCQVRELLRSVLQDGKI